MTAKHGREPHIGTEGVAQTPREAPFPRQRSATYVGHVSHGPEEPPTPWGRYVKALTDRPGWSVARLSRESGIERGTIFRWISGRLERVTVESVRLVAETSGDDIDRALRAAAGLTPDGGVDTDEDEIEFEIRLIQASDLPPEQKRAMVDYARELQRRQQAERAQVRERQRVERRSNLQAMIDLAKGGGTTRPAT